MQTTRQQLESLLQETPAAAHIRQNEAFNRAAGGQRKVVIFGAGRLGRSVLRGLSASDLQVVAFSDNNPKSWETIIDGIGVLSPTEAASRYSQTAVFVVAIWHPSQKALMASLLAQARGLGCRAVPFPLLFWRQADVFLPNFFWDLPERLLGQRHDILAGFDLLHDDGSREAFLAQIRLRLHADFEGLGAVCHGEQYFPGIFSLSNEECFVDCGAYTGDSIRSFISQTDNRFRKVVAFEVDAAVTKGLQDFVNSIGRPAVLYDAAVGAHRGVVRFAGDGIGGGRVTGAAEAGSIEVRCVRLDDALADDHITFIKMDIEGAELQALEGAERVIWRDRPVLAVCGYHKPDHLWRVLSSLKRLAPDSALFVRSHCTDGLDTVCYAVPPERQVALASHDGKGTRRDVRAAKSRAQKQGSVA